MIYLQWSYFNHISTTISYTYKIILLNHHNQYHIIRIIQKFFVISKQIFLYTNMNDQELTIYQVIENYQALSSPNLLVKKKANNFLISLLHREEALNISRELIINQNDPNYQVLGAQILYQKVAQQLQDMNIGLKTQLRNFIFSILQNETITLIPLIDKLVSALSLIICTLLFGQWKNFMNQLLQFMKRSPNCLKNGLFLLERIPEELRITNRIQLGVKQQIIEEFFKYEQNMAQIFLQVLDLEPEGLNQNIHHQLIKRNLNAMQSWSKSRFNFLKYPEIMKRILIQSLQDVDKFENAIVVVVQTIKSASLNKDQSLNPNLELEKELQLYSQAQKSSIMLIVQYVKENRSTFMDFNNFDLQAQHRESFVDIVKQSVLNFGFLIMQSVGFQFLEIIMYFTNAGDLKTSYQTFQFWMDMSQKIANHKKIPENVRNQFNKYMVKLFEVINSKTIVDIDEMLDDPELKEQLTVDDPTSMTYSQYRKETILMYQYIYNYFLKITNSPNSFFEACYNMILQDLSNERTDMNNQKCFQFHKNTELALFCLKSSQQSMVSDADSENIRKILSFILENITNNQVRAKARVIAQVMLLISQCTREIKIDNNLLYQCLKFTMQFITDENLCFYSSRAFKNIVQTLDTVNDPSLVFNLIDFYVSKEFSRQLIIGQILQGVFGTIEKFQNRSLVPEMMSKLISNISEKFNKATMYLKEGQKFNTYQQSLPFYVPLLEIKTILSCYLSTTKTQFRNFFLNDFQNLCNSGLEMLVDIMPYCLKTAGQKLILYNELGFSCSIYRSALKICGISRINMNALTKILNQTLGDCVLANNAIVQMCGMLGLLSDTLITFTTESQTQLTNQQQMNLGIFNNWFQNKNIEINQFFFEHFSRIELADTDVIKWFFTLQQSFLLYNQQLFLSIGHLPNILDLGIHCIRHINEQKMQRKVVNVLYLCCHLSSLQLQSRKQRILSESFRAIPIINSISYHNLSKIFIFLFLQMDEVKCAEYIYFLLKGNPFTDLSQNVLTLIAQSFFFCLKVQNQRYLMMVCKDMQDVVLNGEKTDTCMQLELRLKNWQRENNKKMAAKK